MCCEVAEEEQRERRHVRKKRYAGSTRCATRTARANLGDYDVPFAGSV